MDGSRNSLNGICWSLRDFLFWPVRPETYLMAAEGKIGLAKAGQGSYIVHLPILVNPFFEGAVH